MDRKPKVAGQFYPGDPFRIKDLALKLVKRPEGHNDTSPPAILAMLPHAGYIFSGPTAGRTLARSGFEGAVLMLGPKHTGMGSKISIWDDGSWLFPGAALPVNNALARALCTADARITPDHMAHLGEHSLEVQLPLLYYLNPQINIVPIIVAETDFTVLSSLADSMCKILKSWPHRVNLLVSSDMSHYISAEQARQQDDKAIERILALDPEGLFSVVRREKISMCGILPMTLGLLIAAQLGATRAELIDYANSGEVTNETEKVVGYAGMLVY